MIRDTSAQDTLVDTRPGRSRPRLMAAALIVAVLASLAALTFTLAGWMSSDRSIDAASIRTAVVSRGSFVRDINAQGRIVAAVKPSFYSPATGIVSFRVKAGDPVNKDDLLATVYSPEIQNEFDQEQATYDSMSTDLQRQQIQTRQTESLNQKTIDMARVTLQAAERELKRAEKAKQVEAISVLDLEKARDDRNTARLAYRHAIADAKLARESQEFELQTQKLQLDRQQLTLDNLRRRIDELTIHSPITGIVGSVAVDERAAVNQNQALLTVIDLSAFEIEAGIPETYADELAAGMDVEILYNGRTYPGTLGAISPQVIANQVTARVRFNDDLPAGLRQNQRVTTRIILEQRDDVVTVARGAFIDSGGGRHAWVITPDDMAVKTPVELGARSISAVEVLSGLAEGDRIIVSSTSEFNKADVIRITD